MTMQTKIALLLSFLMTTPIFAQQVLDAIAHNPFGDTSLIIRDITDAAAGNIWVCGAGGNVFSYNGTDWSQQVVTGFESDDFYAIAVDADNHIWLSANRMFRENEVLFYNDTSWVSYDSNDDPAFNLILDIFVAPDGKVWMGSLTSLIKFQGSEWDSYHQFNSPLQGKNINNIFSAGNGSIWLSGENFLNKTDGDTNWESHDLMDIFPFGFLPHVQDMVIDKSGDLWIATTRGLFKLSGNSFTSFETTLGETFYQTIAIDKDDAVWLGKIGLGLQRLKGTQLDSFPADGVTVPSEKISAMFVDQNNVLWLAGTEGGIMQIKGLKTTVQELSPSSTIKIYPTISSGQFQIEGLAAGDRISVYDLNGRLISTRISEESVTNLYLSDVPEAWYLVRIQQGESVWSKKIAVKR